MLIISVLTFRQWVKVDTVPGLVHVVSDVSSRGSRWTHHRVVHVRLTSIHITFNYQRLYYRQYNSKLSKLYYRKWCNNRITMLCTVGQNKILTINTLYPSVPGISVVASLVRYELWHTPSELTHKHRTETHN